MKNKEYSKPVLNFVTLCNEENIAEQCFPGDKGNTRYFDTLGVGYVSYYSSNQCNGEDQLEFLVITYYVNEEDKTGRILDPNVAEDAVMIKELKDKLYDYKDSNRGFSPFKGENSGFFPPKPGPDFS